MWQVKGLGLGAQQQGGDAQESIQSREGALLLFCGSEPPCHQAYSPWAHGAPGHTEPLALLLSPFKDEQVGPGSCRGQGVPRCTGARLLPGTWAPSFLGRRGALSFLGVGDFAQKDDALSVFVQYGNQKRPVETDS